MKRRMQIEAKQKKIFRPNEKKEEKKKKKRMKKRMKKNKKPRFPSDFEKLMKLLFQS